MTNVDQAVANNIWFHEEAGQRKGPITEEEIIGLIKTSKISYGTAVWKKGLADWQKIEETELRVHLEALAPPPLSGDHIDNSLVWVLAFAPLIGRALEYLVASLDHGGYQLAAQLAMQNNEYWFVTLILNIGLCLFDEQRLYQAGHKTSNFKSWWKWLVPVYLYQRAKHLKQNLSYFVVWMVCFGLLLLS